jgi:Fuc2NAc and GlcNAc transferase
VPALIDRLAGSIPLLPQLASQPSPRLAAVFFALAAGLSWLLLWGLLPLLRRGLLDQPNRRSSHRIATPRGGGLSFVVAASCLNLLLGQGRVAWIPLICVPLAVVGLLDDRFDLPAASRYLAQMLTAVALLAMATTPLPAWSLPVVLIAITAVINFFNFMDGLDGLVGLSALVLMAACGQVLLAGAVAGFLLWNWSPAKVFMGDVGSTWLGAVFAGLVLQQPTTEAAFSVLLLGLPLLGDALVCVLRRLGAGQAVFQAHRLHLFQRLQRAGWSHRKVALAYGAATALLALCRQSGSVVALLGAAGVVLLLAWQLEQGVAVPFATATEEN